MHQEPRHPTTLAYRIGRVLPFLAVALAGISILAGALAAAYYATETTWTP